MPETDIVVTGPEDLVKLAAGEPAEGAEPAPQQDATDAGAQPAETAAVSETVDPKEEKGEKKGIGWQKRIDKLTAEKYQDKQRIDALAKELSELRSKAAKPPEEVKSAEPEKPQGKPARDAYQSDSEFYEALTDWKYDQRTAKEKQDREVAEQNERGKAVIDAYFERVEQVRGKIDDWDDVIRNSNVGIPQSASIAIYESESGPEVMYHLATHKDEAQKLWEMSPARQIAYIERIALQLSPPTPATETAPVSKAPPPIKPVGATATRTASDDDSISDEEWVAKNRKAFHVRRKG